MTYARARLWLGITGVGTIVLLSLGILISGLADSLFPTSEFWSFQDVIGLVAFVIGFWMLMIPFDVCGGYLLPLRWQRESQSFAGFLKRWATGSLLQVSLFLLAAVLILAAGRVAGVLGALSLVLALLCVCLVSQGVLIRLFAKVSPAPADASRAIEQELASCDLPKVSLLWVENRDPGFTGGVVGLPGFETLVLPRLWAESLSDEQLVIAVLRRIEAIRSGSRTRGVLLATVWIVGGFALACSLPNAGVQSVSQLINSCCGFTLWMFLGLLTLPTISRAASYQIDHRILQQGIPREQLQETLTVLDRLQDDEPRRPALIETIFHPVPSLQNRGDQPASHLPGAWHALRMTLFLSWACVGLLSRAVHCNAGRPELWVMLPTD